MQEDADRLGHGAAARSASCGTPTPLLPAGAEIEGGLAAPERDEPGGAEAREAMIELVRGRTLRCEPRRDAHVRPRRRGLLPGRRRHRRDDGPTWSGQGLSPVQPGTLWPDAHAAASLEEVSRAVSNQGAVALL